MTPPVLTFKRGQMGITVAMLGEKCAGQILPLDNGVRATRFAFTVRMFDEPRSGTPAGSLPAAKRAFVSKVTEVLRAAGLLDWGVFIDIVDEAAE